MKKKPNYAIAEELFGDASLNDNESKPKEGRAGITLVNVDSLKQNPDQPRFEITEDSVISLANSIESEGLLQPIVVYKDEDDEYIILFGHRRVAAYKYLDREMIEAVITERPKEDSRAVVPLIENLQRQNMHIIETAFAYNKALKTRVVKNQTELANKLGLSQGTISKTLSVLKLSKEVHEAIIRDNYKIINVISALSKMDSDIQIQSYEKIKNMSEAEAIALLKQVMDGNKKAVSGVVKKANSYKFSIAGLSERDKIKIEELMKQVDLIIKGNSNGD